MRIVITMWHNFIWAGLMAGLLTSCLPAHNVILPPPMPKPSIQQNTGAQIEQLTAALGMAQLHIDRFGKVAALARLDVAKRIVTTHTHIPSYLEKHVHADISYTRHGLIRHLYVPLKHGKYRLATVRDMLTAMQALQIPAKSITLVRIDPAPESKSLLIQLRAAEDALHMPDKAGNHHSFFAAGRELGRIYTTSMINVVVDDLPLRVRDYLDLAYIAHQSRKHALSQILLDKAEDTLDRMKRTPENYDVPQRMVQLEKEIAHTRETIARKD